MRAVVVGAGWGQLHVRALRSHGVDVVALCGAPDDAARTRAAAHGLGVPRALDDLADVLDLQPDVVTVATSARTHGTVLRQLVGAALICEKTVLGLHGDPVLLPAPDARVWVDYGAGPRRGPGRRGRAALRALRGELDEDAARATGLFNPARAWAIDDCVRAAVAQRDDPPRRDHGLGGTGPRQGW